jgi:hypothetical protein
MVISATLSDYARCFKQEPPGNIYQPYFIGF